MVHFTNALRYHQFGKPDETLRLEQARIEDPGPDDVLLQVLAAPINPADIGRIMGVYGELPELPATGGIEGVAKIIDLGTEVTAWQKDDLVFVPNGIGSWQTHALAKAKDLFRAPDDLPLDTAAMGWVNPATAWLMLRDFAALKAGDWIAQNAATSAVGKLVIQFARHKGLRTVNLARSPEQAEHLKELGADIVLEDSKDAAREALEKTGGEKAKVALNAVGGESAYGLARMLENKGVIITYGGMVKDPSPFPTRYLIFNDIRLKGFWVSRWYADATRQTVETLHNELFQFMAATGTKMDVAARYRLEQWPEALGHAWKAGKPGKILFKM